MKQDNGQFCENCKFWNPFGDDEDIGWCMRHAPVIVSAMCDISYDDRSGIFLMSENALNATQHPVTHISSSCGEWEYDGVKATEEQKNADLCPTCQKFPFKCKLYGGEIPVDPIPLLQCRHYVEIKDAPPKRG